MNTPNSTTEHAAGERRLTPTERLHQALMTSLERPTKTAEPTFTISREKGHASGPAASPTVWTLSAHVPVCDEYPTAELAFEAALGYARRFEEAFPNPNVRGELDPDEARKVAAINARKAAAKP